MTAVILIGLMVACGLLWHRSERLAGRVHRLEADVAGWSYRLMADAPTPREMPPEPAPAHAAPGYEVIRVEVEPPYAPPPARPSPPTDEPIVETRQPRVAISFEDIFGRYLPIWAGGITLAVAGFLIVKYSIDAGLLSPVVRVICGLLFGGGLIALAEAALRSPRFAHDPRICQALAGAGVATLYASVLVAANLYHLVSPMTAFIGLAGVTVLAAALSLRFGAPSAVLGLVGGLSAPALVGSASPDVPLLATYLALTVGGLCALGRTQRWWWLGALALAGGFGWSALLLLSGLTGTAATVAVGGLILALGIGLPLLLDGKPAGALRLGGAIIGCAQMAAIVATGGFAPLSWGLYGLIAAATIWLSRREAMLAEAPPVALGIGILLTLAWPKADASALAQVIAIGAVIHGGPSLWRLWRADGRLSDAIQIAAIAAAVALVPLWHYYGQAGWLSLTALATLAAVLSGGAAALGWRNATRHSDARFAILAVSAVTLAMIAAWIALPLWAYAPVTGLAAVAMLLLGVVANDRRIEPVALALAALVLPFLIGVTGLAELLRAFGEPEIVDVAKALLRWAIPAFALLAFARWSRFAPVRYGAEGGAMLFAYVALAQLVPSVWQALIPAAAMAAFAAWRGRTIASVPALAVAMLLSLLWAAATLRLWAMGSVGALVGMPLYVTELPLWAVVMISIAAPGAALAMLLWRKTLPDTVRLAGMVAGAGLATIVAHVSWKQVFAITDFTAFTASGMAERTLWEMLLLGAALTGWRLAARRMATGLSIAGLLHFLWFTALLHNPLWQAQAVGPWLIPAYACAGALVWLAAKFSATAYIGRVRDGLWMVLILLFAATALRQLFHGSMLSLGDVTPFEDICRSLLAIILAIGFLVWGIRRQLRDWRIASLLLMLGAVGKVFLFDAAGLDGLLRIASFAALGFSLIGVGWLYSRTLPDVGLTEDSLSPDTDNEIQEEN